MLATYLPLVFLVAIAAIFVGASMVAARRLGPSKDNPVKRIPYESGIIPELETDVRQHRFAIKFYLVAMLFIIFDVEAVFLHPWATVLRDLGWYGLGVMAVFIILLFESYYYILVRGGLEWD